MRFNSVYNPNLHIIEVTTDGLAAVTDLLEMVHRNAELCRKEGSANILVDHSELDASSLTMRDIQTISDACVSLKESFEKRRCAHVVSNALQFGFVRAWEMLIEANGLTELTTKLFKKREEALAWVKESS